MEKKLTYSENDNNITRPNSHTIIGFGIIALGALLLLDQFTAFSFGAVFQLIPMLFIALGIWQLVQNRFQQWIGPAIMIVVALVMQLAVFGIVSDVWRLWPLVLVAVGLSMLVRKNDETVGSTVEIFSGSDSKYHDDTFDLFTMFGGIGRQMTTQEFRGGNMTALFGGVEVDLTEMQVARKPAVINVFTMFGGLTIRASPDMLVRTDVVAIFGGAGDERKQRKMLAGETPDVVVKGFAMFGGVSIE